eukprot:TRINITY_DN10149_c0_g1_i1.p1 TRINITY_DN10149_c0_g1~~TRINITY_DN10149_c0_g1_i1.p1  ORF type:complete len:299 (+),score=39.42 TRINITY_DN10149_c0_g1_i1:103-897(+)
MPSYDKVVFEREETAPDGRFVSMLNYTIEYALKARKSTTWAQEVPWEHFLNDVLPYASVDEPRENWRILFYDILFPLVKNVKSIPDAFAIINSRIWQIWNISFVVDSTPKIMAPLETIAYRYASCTGHAILLVDALRSVGIPARVVGCPAWNTPTGGNHNWVELFFMNAWSFVEPRSNSFNATWFYPDPAKKSKPGYEHGIFAVSYKYTGDHFPMSWAFDDYSINGVDVTSSYLNAAISPRPPPVTPSSIFHAHRSHEPSMSSC